MAASIYPPATATSVLVNTRTQPKIVFLPAASTIAAGKLLFVKDICGNAANSSIYLSTTGRDSFDGRSYSSITYGLMSTNFQSVLLAPDGLLNWMILQNYNSNAITKQGFQGITQTFSYTGANQTFTAPQSTYIILYMWGAGGGRSSGTGYIDNDGGAGAYITGTLTITPGETLTIIVGQGGDVNQTTTGYGGGGPAIYALGCAAGGGRSAIQRSSNDIVVAGAGSGGGWVSGVPATWFGTSTNGSSVNGLNGGGGGTQLAGGALGITSGYASGTAGSKGLGGSGSQYASGGGGGYYGGGGGGVSGGNGGTGGAGSSYIDLISAATGATGSGSTAPGSTSPYYANNAARGGISGTTRAGNGLIVIRY